MDSKEVIVALAGNPNTGKTTVFNLLTGSNQKTGNWPGVTVKRVEGEFEYEGYRFKVVDTPGVYSLYFAESLDHKIARDFLLGDNYDVVVLVVDSTNMERNFYLLTQLMEARKNIVVVLNMIDEAEKKGMKIDSDELEKITGLKVVKMVASRGIGIEMLKEKILEAFIDLSIPAFPSYGDLNKYIFALAPLFRNTGSYPPESVVIGLMEEDKDFWVEFSEHPEVDKVRDAMKQIRLKYGEDPEVVISGRRYAYIHGLVKEVVSFKKDISLRIDITEKIDNIITKWWVGVPLFLVSLYGIFELVFGVGNPLAELLDSGVGWLSEKLKVFASSKGVADWFTSMLSDGVIPGVGSVLVFVPNIFILFFSFAFLEDIGIMSRFAFVFDRFMHLFGLHGKSFIPMSLGFGCNVPAVLGTRILETQKDRILTMLIIPFMSCSARLPVYLMFAEVFFPEHSSLVVFSLYLIGILVAMITGRFFRKVAFKGEYVPLIIELPPYRFPVLKVVLRVAWENTWLFVRKAGTVIFAGVVIVWGLSYLPVSADYASKSSFLGQIGSVISPVFKPAGFGFWQASVSLLVGLIAKELVVGTLGAILSAGGSMAMALKSMFSPISAYSFLLMVLLYFPCIATISAIKHEAGWKWALITVFYTLFLGWLVSTFFYQVASLF